MREIRPKVYADIDGAEWRCVVDTLELRDKDDESGELAPEFVTGGFASNSEWMEFLVRQNYCDAERCCANATLNPMTAEEALADDEAIGA